MKEILLFPGAFNPPHMGHVSAIRAALKQYVFDELWVMPSGRRSDKDIRVDYNNRKRLGGLFVEYLGSQISIPVKLITAELDDKTGRYTEDILKEVKSQPGFHCTQLIGSDGYMRLKNSNHIADGEKFLIVKRSGYDLPEDIQFLMTLIVSDRETKDISSTMIREMVKARDVRYKELLPEKIYHYIEER